MQSDSSAQIDALEKALSRHIVTQGYHGLITHCTALWDTYGAVCIVVHGVLRLRRYFLGICNNTEKLPFFRRGRRPPSS